MFKVTRSYHLLCIMKLEHHFYKGKVYCRTDPEGPGRKQSYNSTLPLTLALDRVGWPKPHLGPLYSRERDLVPILQEDGWAPGTIWTGAENLAPLGIRSPDRPARSVLAIPTELPGPLTSSYFVLKPCNIFTLQ